MDGDQPTENAVEEPKEEVEMSKEPKKKPFLGRITKTILMLILLVLVGAVFYAG
jgi:hypothetical protein